MSNFKNSDQPANPTTPVVNQFNQTIMYLGFSKKEVMAKELFLSHFTGCFPHNTPNSQPDYELIKQCYDIAEKFLNFEAEQIQSDIISLS